MARRWQENSGGLLVPVDYAEPAAPELREIATTGDGRDITRGYVGALSRLSPQDPLLRSRGDDYEMYREVLRDAQVFATLQQRRLALASTEWEVLPGGDRAVDRAAADFLRAQLDAIAWDRISGLMHYGVFYGYAVAECLYRASGRYIELADLRVRDRRRFCFDGAQHLRLLTAAAPQGELMPERKFWAFQTGADHGDEPYGMGLAHWCYWPVLFKRANVKFWLIALEKFGSPTAVGYFPPSASQAERDKLLAALRAIQLDAGIALPEGMKVELLQGDRSGANDYQALCQYMDQAIAKICIGQVMTAEAVGGQYKAEVQKEILDSVVASDADLLCESFNRSVAVWLTEWNFPSAQPPRVWRRTEQDEDLNLRAERESKIASTIGYRPTLAQITDTYGGDWEVVPSAAQSADTANDSPPFQGGAARSAGVVTSGFAEETTLPPTNDPTPITDYADQLAQNAAPAWRAWLTQIRRRVEEAENLESLRDDLLALYAELDPTDLAQVMQIAFACAELSGRYDVTQGD